MTAFGSAVKDTYGTNLLAPARGPVAASLADGGLHTGWSPPDGAVTGGVELTLPRQRTFDRIKLGEDITRGQHVESFAVDIGNGTDWVQAASGTTIGYSRILPLSTPVTTDRIRVRVLSGRATPHLATVGLYRSTPPTS